jgi:ubiquitin carboxyl-terminal hydrolase 25/28
MIPEFMEAIAKLDITKKGERKLRSLKLTMKLQRLFGYLINSNRKAVDTTAVTNEIVDDYGKSVRIHEQRDIGEFNINFLARIRDTLELGKEEGKVQVQMAINPESKKQLDRSIALGLSVLLPVSPEDLSKSFIYNTFFGSFLMPIKATDKDGKTIELSTSTTFGQIIISASEKDFYKEWETNYYTEIEDFQTNTVH